MWRSGNDAHPERGRAPAAQRAQTLSRSWRSSRPAPAIELRRLRQPKTATAWPNGGTSEHPVGGFRSRSSTYARDRETRMKTAPTALTCRCGDTAGPCSRSMNDPGWEHDPAPHIAGCGSVRFVARLLCELGPASRMRYLASSADIRSVGKRGSMLAGAGWAMTTVCSRRSANLDEPLPFGPQHPVTMMWPRFDPMSSARRRGE